MIGENGMRGIGGVTVWACMQHGVEENNGYSESGEYCMIHLY
jgi:hypothetical protein